MTSAQWRVLGLFIFTIFQEYTFFLVCYDYVTENPRFVTSPCAIFKYRHRDTKQNISRYRAHHYSKLMTLFYGDNQPTQISE